MPPQKRIASKAALRPGPSDDLSPSITGSSQRRNRHSSQTWDHLKPLITELYLQEGKTVQQVIKRLKQDHDFDTGRRALMAKLEDWNMKKNLPHQDMMILIAKRDERKLSGKDTVFLYNGQKLPDARFDRFLKRGFVVDEIPPSPNAATPPGITYCTPATTDGYDLLEEWQASQHGDYQGSACPGKLKRKPSNTQIELDTMLRHPSKRLREGTIDDSQILGAAEPELKEELINAINFLARQHARDSQLLFYFSHEDKKPFDRTVHAVHKLVDLSSKYPNTQHQVIRSSVLGEDCYEVDINGRINQFYREFGGGPLLEINSANRRERSSGCRIITYTQSYDEFDTDLGRVSLTIRRESHSSATENKDYQERDPNLESHAMTAYFVPKDSTKFPLISASAEIQSLLGFPISSISRLEINRVIPSDSKVFTLVSEGRLEELEEMLQQGKASLRDFDENGASLLFYCMLNAQPEICKFLLSKGLDVDHMAQGDEQTVLNSCFLDEDCSPEEVVRVNHCRRLLFEANADPTLDPDPDNRFLRKILSHGTPESNRLVWNAELTGHFLSISTFTLDGLPALHLHCQGYGNGCQVGILEALLDLGACIDARDCYGRTCLHVFLMALHSNVNACGEEQSDVLRFLITRGADINARDDNGFTVSEMAYMKDLGHWEMSWDTSLSSFVGDLFDSVIHSVGHSIAAHRHWAGIPRQAKYTKVYTRENFEELWEGRENECPYWDDNPWPPSLEDDTNDDGIWSGSSFDSDPASEADDSD